MGPELISFKEDLLIGKSSGADRSKVALTPAGRKKANKTYFFLDGSGGKSTPAGKATGEDPAGSGFLTVRLNVARGKRLPGADISSERTPMFKKQAVSLVFLKD
ncbi:hypothetical protein [Oceanobacillus sp. FSL W7-1293]|uniref:hypothetical protein n=1 Tax=Oceanobacillus sp. FSL W7-1293 TaxID=2921699 RepID=UPI0030CA6D5C